MEHINFLINGNLKKQIKIICAEKGISITEYILSLIRKDMIDRKKDEKST